MRTRFIAIGLFWLSAFVGLAQVGDSQWERVSRIPGIPTLFTNTQATTLSQSVTKPILLNAKTTSPITFLARAVSTGSSPESRYTVTFGSSIDGVNFFTNGTWVFVIGTNASGSAVYSSTNFTHSARWPYLHLISVSMATNTGSGFQLQYAQPRN